MSDRDPWGEGVACHPEDAASGDPDLVFVAGGEEPASSSAVQPATRGAAQPADVYDRLDETLVEVINMAGWPKWCTSGGGNDEPPRTECDFAVNKLKWCARLDFHRGIAADDLLNIKWAELLSHLPRYASVLATQQDPSSVEGKGNAMEMAVGLAYCCYTNFEHLPEGQQILFHTEVQVQARSRWAFIWTLFEELGLKATLVTPVTTPAQTVLYSLPPKAPPPEHLCMSPTGTTQEQQRYQQAVQTAPYRSVTPSQHPPPTVSHEAGESSSSASEQVCVRGVLQSASSSASQPATGQSYYSQRGSAAVLGSSSAVQPAEIVITHDTAIQRKRTNDVVSFRTAHKFLRQWRSRHTRSEQDPPFDIEFERVQMSHFDWPGYLARRSERELEVVFGAAEGFTHCELRFLNVKEGNAKQLEQPYRVDFVCYRSDGAAIRLHPSQAADANPIIGNIEDWAFTAVRPPPHTIGLEFALWNPPISTDSGAAQPADKRKLYMRFSQADQVSHRQARLFLAGVEETWKQEAQAGTASDWDGNLTDDESTFHWRAYLSGWRDGAAVNDEHAGICEFVVCWLDDEPHSRAAFYVKCHDGYETVLEPKAKPSPEKLHLIRWPA